MLKLLVDLRDFCFVYASKRHGAFAEKDYKFKLMALCYGYYMAVLTFLAIIQYKAGIPMPTPSLKGNTLAFLLFALVLHLPYYLLFKYFFFVKLARFPVDKDMRPERFKRLAVKAILFFLLGIGLMVLIPWSTDRLLPAFH